MKKTAVILAAMMFGATALAYSGASDWAVPELNKAEGYGLIPEVLDRADVSEPINRAEFAAVSVRLYEALSGSEAQTGEDPFTDTDDEEVLKAYALGITGGVTADTFEPDTLLSREQAATMLARVYKVYTGKDISSSPQKLFADDEDISRWARDSVYFMAENGIILGMENNIFAPRNITPEQEASGYANTTREQAVIIAERMYERFRSEEPQATDTPQATDEPSAPDSPQATEKPSGETDYLSLIPTITFGEITEEKSDGSSAQITVEGVTQEDYDAYVRTVEGRYPTHVNSLEGASQFVIKTDGTYNIRVSFVGSEMIVSVEDAR